MSAIDELVNSIKRNADRVRQAQIRFAECTSVNWKAKTMTAKGTSDGVEYLDVMLGLGSVYVKPQMGTVCLIGMIDGLEVAAFLIDAEEVELVEAKADEVLVNDGQNGGLVKVKELTGRLNAIEKDLNTLKTVFSTWPPATGDGGAALKAAAAEWAGQQLSLTQQKGIENDKIKH